MPKDDISSWKKKKKSLEANKTNTIFQDKRKQNTFWTRGKNCTPISTSITCSSSNKGQNSSFLMDFVMFPFKFWERKLGLLFSFIRSFGLFLPIHVQRGTSKHLRSHDYRRCIIRECNCCRMASCRQINSQKPTKMSKKIWSKKQEKTMYIFDIEVKSGIALRVLEIHTWNSYLKPHPTWTPWPLHQHKLFGYIRNYIWVLKDASYVREIKWFKQNSATEL